MKVTEIKSVFESICLDDGISKLFITKEGGVRIEQNHKVIARMNITKAGLSALHEFTTKEQKINE